MTIRPWLAPAAALLLLGRVATVNAASLDDLVRAYPAVLAGHTATELIWRDGTRMPVGPLHPDLESEDALAHGSILDQLALPYPAGSALPPGQAPGRVRNQAFFTKLYGDCKLGEVTPKLAPVVWLPKTWGHTITITSVNGVDRSLAAISRELDDLPAQYKKYLHPLGGTYNCRSVAGTEQTSMHSWGAAIDINTSFSNYWRWQRSGSNGSDYVNRIPSEIVATFERHGFIWGGRWTHFDTMHFEYRPELLGYNPNADE